MKLNQKIRRFSGFLILAGYLTVLILNAAHIHHIDLGKQEILINPIDANNDNHLKLYGSEILCSIHFAYSSISGSFDFNENPDLFNNLHPEYFENSDISSRPNKIFTNHYFLRAPPHSFFS